MVGEQADYTQWLVIVNPNAGKGRGLKDWNLIASLLRKYEISIHVCFTTAKKHAIDLTAVGIEKGYRNIIAIGGDGTMNEVVNGCFKQKVCSTTSLTVGMITVGTGNDWGKMFGISTEYEEAVKIIKQKNTVLQDTGVVKYYLGDRKEKRYFVNIAGLGFDALVVRRTNNQKEKGKGGKALYFWNLLKSLMIYKHIPANIIIDGRKLNNEVFTMSLGIGKYSGGGMMQTPNAIPDDGLFDITVINKMRKGEVIRNLKMLYDGTILEHPKINGYTGKDILINAAELIHVEADGETLGHSPVEFNIIPKSINVVYNKLLA
jgi:YegS/Rv2252/BmrU family lipid kinase